MSLRVLIVDDERLARAKIRGYLEGEAGVEIAGEAGDVDSAVAAIRALRPDVLFLDIAMPGGGGFAVLAAVEPSPMAVVFVTAHDEHAVRAFDVDALDYLLKPFDRPRFLRALARARAAVRPLARLIVREGDRVRFLPVETIDWIAAAGNYVEIHAAGRDHLLRETLARLEARLDAERFARVHRRLIVNRDAVVEAAVLPHGEHELLLRDGARLPVGRSYRARFFGG